MTINYPTFFKTRPSIKLQDPLQRFLGTFQDGIIEFSYLDIVKNAGHSCPDVTGAYLMTLKGLKFLYKNETPVRGGLKVSFSKSYTDEITSVMADVISHITGAKSKIGFQGVEGKFDRTNLVFFDVDFNGNVKFERVDTGEAVIIKYDLSTIPIDPKQEILMTKVLNEDATQGEEIEFEVLWQQRVERIFNHASELIEVKKV
jgi:hypothetical protein